MGRGRGRGGSVSGGTVACCGALFFILFVIAAGLVGGSFQIVEPLEYAILQNTITRDLQANRVYTSGRYFTGLARQFLTFPRTRRTIAFGSLPSADSPSLSVQLTEGLITFDLSLQYSLNVTQLVGLYRSYGQNYHARFVQASSSSITSALATGGFNVSDFYAARPYVTATALTAVTAALVPLGAAVWDLQLHSISLPTLNENAIVNTLVTNQAASTAANVQAQQSINAQITVVVGQVNQAIALYISNQTQLANIITQQAAATARQVQLTAASTAWSNFESTLGFNNSELMQYLYLRQIKNLPPAATVAAGFPADTLWSP